MPRFFLLFSIRVGFWLGVGRVVFLGFGEVGVIRGAREVLGET